LQGQIPFGYTVCVGRYWKHLAAVVILLAVTVLYLAYRLFLQNEASQINISFTSQVSGYKIDTKNTNALNDFLDETNFYAVEHIDKKRKNPTLVEKITVTLADNALPLYQVYSTETKKLSYATDYSISDNTLNLLIYVDPDLLETSSQETANRVESAINAQIIRTLLMSIMDLPGSQQITREGDLTAKEEFVKEFVYTKGERELAFQLIKNRL